jgi:hypothetical protein
MVPEKALYWTAVSLLALIVGNHFVARQGDGVPSFANRSMAVIERVSDDADRVIATAKLMLGKDGTHFAPAQAKLACAQTRLASVQTVIAQHEAVFAQVQAERIRIAAMQPLRGTAICPGERLRMAISRVSRDGTI